MFRVIPNGVAPPAPSRNTVYLVKDNWNDMWRFETAFTLIVFDENGARHEPGLIKIGHAGLQPGKRGEEGGAPNLPDAFPALMPGYFSLGQSQNFYETLNELNPELKLQILTGLQDCAYDLSIFDRYLLEPVMQESLLRSTMDALVRTRLHRLAHGHAELTRFQFGYTLPAHPQALGAPPELDFEVEPDSQPPSNIHVIVGRNGAGKTRCLQSLAKTFLQFGKPSEHGQLRLDSADTRGESNFSSLVYVSFSAFDRFMLPSPEKMQMRGAFVGLRHAVAGPGGAIVDQMKSTEEVATEFMRSLTACRSGPRLARWRRAMRTLSSDPLFAEQGISSMLNGSGSRWEIDAWTTFMGLSSGHAVVLLATSKLVELVEEKTLVLFDEPEGHLHPPLLSGFIRAVSDLLIARNGVGLIATHSPVVLQEVPRSCVWKLRRSGAESVAERPGIETFGENVGVLTREVFALEVTQSGFHRLVSEAAAEPGATYETVIARFGDRLGAEGRALARSLVARNFAARGQS